jgi:hypothetical protein
LRLSCFPCADAARSRAEVMRRKARRMAVLGSHTKKHLRGETLRPYPTHRFSRTHRRSIVINQISKYSQKTAYPILVSLSRWKTLTYPSRYANPNRPFDACLSAGSDLVCSRPRLLLLMDAQLRSILLYKSLPRPTSQSSCPIHCKPHGVIVVLGALREQPLYQTVYCRDRSISDDVAQDV